jgi:hypothetical protein
MLGIKAEMNDIFDADSGSFPAALNDITLSQGAYDVYIAVTHRNFTDFFPDYFRTNALSREAIGSSPVDHGQAVIIDCQTGSIKLV